MALYRQGRVEPIGLTEGRQVQAFAADPPTEMRSLISQHLARGSRLEISDRKGQIGTVRITEEVAPGWESADCRDALAVEATAELQPGRPGAGLLIASERPLHAVGERGERAMTQSERQRVAETARGLLAAASEAVPVEARVTETSVDGTSIDLDGDGRQELAALVQVFQRPEPSAELSGGWSLLVILRANNDGTWKVAYSEVVGGSGDAIVKGAKLLGYHDLNGDGVIDILKETRHYESTTVDVVESAGPGFVKSKAGNRGGC